MLHLGHWWMSQDAVGVGLEVAEALADHVRAEDEHQNGHDCDVVLNEPPPKRVQWSRHALGCREVRNDESAHIPAAAPYFSAVRYVSAPPSHVF